MSTEAPSNDSGDEPMPVPASVSLMSRPEQKPLPAPVNNTHRTSGSDSTSCSATVSCCSIRPVMALRRSGRLSVMHATWPSVSTRTSGSVAMVTILPLQSAVRRWALSATPEQPLEVGDRGIVGGDEPAERGLHAGLTEAVVHVAHRVGAGAGHPT